MTMPQTLAKQTNVALSESSQEAGIKAPPIPRLVWAIAALAVAIRIGVAFTTHFTWEDSLITLRYAENIAHGHGFVYNPGERVLGTTTPLYTLLLALAACLHLNPMLVGKACNLLADGALCFVIYRWLCIAAQETAGRVAAFWVAVDPLHVRWAISGMESSLVALCGALVWLSYAQRRSTAAYTTLAVLFLLRWDSVLLLAVLTVAIFWRERRLPVRELALFALLILPWLLFATWYFGNPIPVTGLAKMTVYGWRARDLRLPQLGHLLFTFFGPSALLLTLLALVGLACVRRARLTILLPPIGWFALYWLAFLLSKVLLFPWYVLPPLPVYNLLSALGFAAIAQRVSAAWTPGARQRMAGGIAATTLALTTWMAWTVCRNIQRVEDNLGRPIGLWLRAQSKPTDRIMLEPIGYIGYYSGRPILDVVGLVTPQVLPAYDRRNIAPMWNIAQTFRPEWCVLRPGELDHIHAAEKLAGHSWEEDYALVKTFAYTPPDHREPITFYVYQRTTRHAAQ